MIISFSSVVKMMLSIQQQQHIYYFLLCSIGKYSAGDTDREACITVGSHKRPVVHYQTNGQREKSYNLVREVLCLYEPSSLFSNQHSLTHVDSTMNFILFGSFLPTCDFRPSSLLYNLSEDDCLTGMGVFMAQFSQLILYFSCIGQTSVHVRTHIQEIQPEYTKGSIND